MFSENDGLATQLYSGSCHLIFNQWYHGFTVSAFTFNAEQVVSCDVYQREYKKFGKELDFLYD